MWVWVWVWVVATDLQASRCRTTPIRTRRVSCPWSTRALAYLTATTKNERQSRSGADKSPIPVLSSYGLTVAL